MKDFKDLNDAFDQEIMSLINSEVTDAVKSIVNKYSGRIREYRENYNEAKANYKCMSEDKIRRIFFVRACRLLEKVKEIARTKERVKDLDNIGKRSQKKMVKKLFAECINDVLAETVTDIDTGITKTKKLLLAEKLVNETLTDKINPVTIKAIETIRDTIGEKPVEEFFKIGLQQKVIDVNVTQEKIQRVKTLLEALRTRNTGALVDGLKQDNGVGGEPQESGNQGIIEVSDVRESEGIHNPDVLPDKP